MALAARPEGAIMDQEQFDSLLIGAAMARAEAVGWRRVAVAEAARTAGLPLDEARMRFPVRATVLLRLGMQADRAALIDDGSVGSVRERLFDLLMRRIDVLQQYRGGVRAALRAVPFDPPLALLLANATAVSMDWVAQAAGVDTTGLLGRLRVNGLVAVWLRTVHAWDRDDSVDLSTTMAALDKALDRAEWLGRMMNLSPSSDGGDLGELPPELPSEPPAPDPGVVDPMT